MNGFRPELERMESKRQEALASITETNRMVAAADKAKLDEVYKALLNACTETERTGEPAYLGVVFGKKVYLAFDWRDAPRHYWRDAPHD